MLLFMDNQFIPHKNTYQGVIFLNLMHPLTAKMLFNLLIVHIVISGAILILTPSSQLISFRNYPSINSQYQSSAISYNETDSIIIQNDLGFVNYTSIGEGTSENPYVLEYWQTPSIRITDTTVSFIIQQCSVVEGGIILRNCFGAPIVQNNIIINPDNRPNQYANDYLGTADTAAIYLNQVPNANIIENICSGEISLESSESPFIERNNLTGGGIYCNFCPNASISFNYITHSDFDGIHINHCDLSLVENNTCLTGSRYGIAHYYSNYTILYRNYLKAYEQTGISFASGTTPDESAHCLISYNILRENEGYGIKVTANSRNLTFHHNSFIQNGETPQTYDYSTNLNYWFHVETKLGNYWSDHKQASPYQIAGGNENLQDEYPLDANLQLLSQVSIIGYPIILFSSIGCVCMIILGIRGQFAEKCMSERKKKI